MPEAVLAGDIAARPPRAGPDAWTGADLAPGAGRHRLSADCLAEIAATLALLRANPLPVLALSPRDVEMPACAALMAEVRRELDAGLGFAIVDRLPLDAMDRDEATAIYWLLAQMTGRPVAQKWSDGRLLYTVADYGKPSGNGVRPDRTNEEQSFHTDNSYNIRPPDHVGLLCLAPAMEGGISRVVSMTAVHNRMAAAHPDLLPRLYRPYFFDRQREHAEGDAPTLANPVLREEAGGGLRVRVSRQLIYRGYAMAGKAVDRESEAGAGGLVLLRGRPGDVHRVPVRTGPDPVPRQPGAGPQAHRLPGLAGAGAQAPPRPRLAARGGPKVLQRLNAPGGAEGSGGMIRTGEEYRESIRDGRAVWIDGERVRDVPSHPAFRPIVDIRAPHPRHGPRGRLPGHDGLRRPGDGRAQRRRAQAAANARGLARQAARGRRRAGRDRRRRGPGSATRRSARCGRCTTARRC